MSSSLCCIALVMNVSLFFFPPVKYLLARAKKSSFPCVENVLKRTNFTIRRSRLFSIVTHVGPRQSNCITTWVKKAPNDEFNNAALQMYSYPSTFLFAQASLLHRCRERFQKIKRCSKVSRQLHGDFSLEMFSEQDL